MNDESLPDEVEGGQDLALLVPGQRWLFRARRMDSRHYTTIQGGSRLLYRWIKVATGYDGYLKFFCPRRRCGMRLRIEPLGLSTNRRGLTPVADGATIVLGAWCPCSNEPFLLRIEGPNSDGDWLH